jgi:hypothetical protein
MPHDPDKVGWQVVGCFAVGLVLIVILFKVFGGR